MIRDTSQFKTGVSFEVITTSAKYHTYTSWNLRQLSDVQITYGNPKLHIINEVQGIHGVIDITEHFGDVKFEDDTIKFAFDSLDESYDSWESILMTIRNAIHGKMCKIKEDTRPNVYRKGRVYIEPQSKTDKFSSTIVIRCEVNHEEFTG